MYMYVYVYVYVCMYVWMYVCMYVLVWERGIVNMSLIEYTLSENNVSAANDATGYI